LKKGPTNLFLRKKGNTSNYIICNSEKLMTFNLIKYVKLKKYSFQSAA